MRQSGRTLREMSLGYAWDEVGILWGVTKTYFRLLSCYSWGIPERQSGGDVVCIIAYLLSTVDGFADCNIEP